MAMSTNVTVSYKFMKTKTKGTVREIYSNGTCKKVLTVITGPTQEVVAQCDGFMSAWTRIEKDGVTVDQLMEELGVALPPKPKVPCAVCGEPTTPKAFCNGSVVCWPCEKRFI